ncbi:phosphatidylinositol 3,4,5-trisphosphate 3-phosphatase and protein-tyrosine-phosphatase PTEN2A-like isoform X2 [Mangifera indica]|uniref:phosphatidylinositol 3,4,5-trisphosphate 3-phosphatase and protein-tyrosine-phosphatase PTEN2A-like isoform X2 n=1 Tax=Mangifera indica TaxID=29780 RepID=UPI001CFADE30|nr:phosphatidylinositol 3,4,5-trisphosphate 3-phosphatase and protein-tyrosine-phosphatase PTEN2A-like isoform X2 [Mangifera indica]
MDSGSANSTVDPEVKPSVNVDTGTHNSMGDPSPKLSTSGISTWAKNLKIPQPFAGTQEDSPTGSSAKSTFARFTSGFGLRLSPKSPQAEDVSEGTSTSAQPGLIGTITKSLVDSSKSAVKAVQVKARHAVSQNKRRYQEGGFDLDMTYITENVIAMGFPAGDMSSGFFGYVEGFYRNHMEEVIKFFETYHKDKYKVYNLCSERLYDATLFEGKVASFPFDDHNCPPIQLIISFCHSAYSWLKQDIENVVVVHCKAGMARTGLMISSLLLYLKFFPTAEESIDYYNQKRCVDGKGLVLPSQIRYVKYFERVLTYFNGENQPGRRCMLRGFRLHRCPYWVRPHITVSDHNGVLFSTKGHPRTKDLSSEDFWFSAPKKGIMVFALPGEPGLTELKGDFKIHFHDRQGDFYCWLNTTMVENRKILNTSDLDGFDKRKLPSPGFQVEVVLVDYNGPVPASPSSETVTKKSDENSDSEAEGGSSKSKKGPAAGGTASSTFGSETKNNSDKVTKLAHATEQVSLSNVADTLPKPATSEPKKEAAVEGAIPVPGHEVPNTQSEFKAMAADASVFSFGDEDDYESE